MTKMLFTSLEVHFIMLAFQITKFFHLAPTGLKQNSWIRFSREYFKKMSRIHFTLHLKIVKIAPSVPDVRLGTTMNFYRMC